MSNICAGIGRGQMEVLDKHVNLRREMNAFYESIFKDINEVTVFTAPNADYYPNYWLSSIIVNLENPKNLTREKLRLYLESKNIESRPLW